MTSKEVTSEPIDWYKCPRCGMSGYCSVYYETCTACANYLRFGSIDPLYIQEVDKQSTLPTKMELSQEYAKYAPLSICTCGHTGDGANSNHVDLLQDGSGSCRVPGCPCRQFTWAEWTERAEILLGLKEVKS